MKSFVDIHVVLATHADIEDFHSDPDEAVEQLNTLLHLVYDMADEDIDTTRLERCLHHTWETWYANQELLNLTEEEMHDWANDIISNWDDTEDYEH